MISDSTEAVALVLGLTFANTPATSRFNRHGGENFNRFLTAAVSNVAITDIKRATRRASAKDLHLYSIQLVVCPRFNSSTMLAQVYKRGSRKAGEHARGVVDTNAYRAAHSLRCQVCRGAMVAVVPDPVTCFEDASFKQVSVSARTLFVFSPAFAVYASANSLALAVGATVGSLPSYITPRCNGTRMCAGPVRFMRLSSSALQGRTESACALSTTCASNWAVLSSVRTVFTLSCVLVINTIQYSISGSCSRKDPAWFLLIG